jgi:imidazolonepropionase-like amidohydrolase
MPVICRSSVIALLNLIAVLHSTSLYAATSGMLVRAESVDYVINARLLDADWEERNAEEPLTTLIFQDGNIVSVEESGAEPPLGASIIDATGRWITPGLVDIHTHLGVFSSPRVPATFDLNERTGNNTGHLQTYHAVWPQDPGFDAARAGGVTTLSVLPGSSNLIGGQTVTLKNVPAVRVQDMFAKGARPGLKMSCGENPIKVYGGRNQVPATRMGVFAELNKAFAEAAAFRRDAKGDSVPSDPRLAALVAVLNGTMDVHVHCYRADEIAHMLELAESFGFKVRAFHHATEAYKVAALIARHGAAVAAWPNRWGFKMEAYDFAEGHMAILEAAGVETVIHSDNAEIGHRLNMHAAIALADARAAGFEVGRGEAIAWITKNPARVLGMSDEIGTLAVGKRADLVIWSSDPLSVYALPEIVLIDGQIVFDRRERETGETSDLLMGQEARQ